jgi:hypothetical protein
MPALSTAELLAAWENAMGQPPLDQSLRLLSAWLNQPAPVLARLNLGRRDAYLLQLRAAIFGPQLRSLAECEACGECLEFVLDEAELRSGTADPGEPTLRVSLDGYEVVFRLPNTLDLKVLRRDADLATNRRLLLECSLLEARHADCVVTAGQLPESVVSAICERMVEADPLAEVRIALTCPGCGHCWKTNLDIGAYLWRELDAWARRILGEVHVLASTYGWSEDQILGLTPARRQFYLNLAAA